MKSWDDLFNEKYRADDALTDNTLSKEEWERKFDSIFGHNEGTPFVAWSDKYVYFPVCYDGADRIGRVPRNPGEFDAEHFGGG